MKTKTSILIILLALISYGIKAQIPVFSWAKSMGGSSADIPQWISADNAGNVYSTGGFYDVSDFDPGNSTFNLISSGGPDAFISKLDKNGNFKWAKKIGGTENDFGMALAADSFGNVYTTGIFSGSVDLNPNSASQIVTSSGIDIFILKLDSNGNFKWAKNIGGHIESYALKTDKHSNVYVSGYFYNTIDFNPNQGVFNLTASGSTHPDAFILKLDSSGGFVWAKSFGGNNIDYVFGISIDPAGNIYSCGNFKDTSDFDPGPGVHQLIAGGGFSAYISKLDSMGDFVWAVNLAGTTKGGSLISDMYGNVYVCGSFSGLADFDPGQTVVNLSSVGANDLYILKLDSSGVFVWVRQIGATNNNVYYSIALDKDNNVYTACSFIGIIDVDPSAGSLFINSMGSNDVFILKLDSMGSFKWAGQIQGTGSKSFRSICIDRENAVLLTGNFSYTADFNPDSLNSFFMTSNGESDVYVLKLIPGNANISVSEVFELQSKPVYPNPGNGLLNVDLSNLRDVSVRVLNLAGQCVFAEKQINESLFSFRLNQPAGVYWVEVSSGAYHKVFKYVKLSD